MTCYEPQLTTFWSFLDNFGIELDRGRILDRPSLTKNDQESEKKMSFRPRKTILNLSSPRLNHINAKSNINLEQIEITVGAKIAHIIEKKYSILREIQK